MGKFRCDWAYMYGWQDLTNLVRLESIYISENVGAAVVTSLVQLNEYETAPYFIQLSQNLT
jgi:hypothetical protein